ncbi:MAG: DNA-directed RNA polymerase subunit B, partial [Candidatus Bathyarchaeota archaeon]
MSDVYFNGKLVGNVDNMNEFATGIRKSRREGVLSHYINVRTQSESDSVFVNVDKNRVRRPLIVVENGKSKLTDELADKFISGETSWEALTKQGVIEYLDAAEEENTLIALDEKDLTKDHTHLEIDPAAIFGVTVSLISYPNFSPTPRILIGQKTQQQGLGYYALNYDVRFDTNVNILHYPQKPIVKTFMQDVMGDDRVFGQNIVIAVMNYDGYNMRDAVIFNRQSFERGLGRSTHFRPYVAEKLRYAGAQMDEIMIPDKDIQGYTTEEDYKFLEADGIISPELDVKGGEVLIGRTSPPRFLGKIEAFSTAANIRKDNSVRLRGNESGTVGEVILTESQDGNMLVKVKVREDRKPELGDKYSTRYGQKGVIGRIVDSQDMPFTASGIVPDILFSPNGLFKRMTINQLLEALAGKVGALAGRYINGTAFNSEDPEELRKELLKCGFTEDGTETMYDGRTGKMFGVRIFVGNMYYFRLHHQVADKMQVRSRGPIQLLTRQPTEGKIKEGGTRMGEMEKEALVGHGTSLLIKERFD